MPPFPFTPAISEPVLDLRRYQQRVMDEVTEYLMELRREQSAGGHNRHASADAWKTIGTRRRLQGVSFNAKYGEMETGDGRDLPNVCLLVPTGGGKTLLATQVIGRTLRHLLPEREGGGLVLWLVPTQSIYDQTVSALRDPNHLYYRALKNGTGSRIKVWEKEQMGGLTPAGLRRDLNVLVLMLQSVNRRPPAPGEETGKKSDFLRYFRDGRVHPAHFPPENDLDAHRRLRDGFTTPEGDQILGTGNLDTLHDSPMVRTSLANLVRLCRPIVIVDEQQKAASPAARETLAGLNPALLVQLSATPKQSNLLVRVTGKELLQEAMIKLPIAVKTSGISDWQVCLSDAHREQKTLELAAEKWRETSGKYIRPYRRGAGRTHGSQTAGRCKIYAQPRRANLPNHQVGRPRTGNRGQNVGDRRTQRRGFAPRSLPHSVDYHPRCVARRLGLPVRVCAGILACQQFTGRPDTVSGPRFAPALPNQNP